MSESDYEEELGESKTFLGFVDVPISESERPELEDTFIGGKPIWLNPNSPPPKELLQCKSCQEPMHLLLQCYANLANTFYDRVIYIFGCNKAQCRRKKGSVRALRALSKDPDLIKKREQELEEFENKKKVAQQKEAETKSKLESLANSLFSPSDSTNAQSNPFSNPFAQESSNPFAQPEKKEPAKPTYAEVTKPVEKARPQVSTEPVNLPSYPGYILYVDQEAFDLKKQKLPPLPEVDAAASTQTSQPNPSNPSKIPTLDENVSKMVDDPTFQHFSHIVSFNPTQVLRYDLNGSPLLYSSKDDVAKLFYDSNGRLRPQALIPNPPYNPSSERRFELQLMPKAIIDLEAGTDDILSGMEWGTIIVATDLMDYIPDHMYDQNHVGYVEEWCGVQWEEELKL
ncbi:hypothetical protein KL918_003739 [Ogataea parapolymorpha]|uniref:Programmed cell death protein 2 n=1 Tax=Ogataea parapolymorpha (strain ATCC 26012 / BCRC 20466 / JCM 22074 / NRRL Y-7560 / DL-1) TaxID=871575 RepID=W1QIR7_OGAPD|nr:Programmed cell death protein 2 [Ogataea parapolymorpha DL-1]ESX02194.1 Programmed cell death protein 2 [Ogataea parapolymorpha DL-1]KAG7866274.1 hypothetical protein KL918_003739 [Ogataea parapolymorpha]KAG7872902.1 hypothetical protein KL916_002632 [Ogataea parapolymorpha]